MDEMVKNAIDARKNSLYTAYDVKGEDTKKIEELFSRIEDFGESCSDFQDFETKFADSPLNGEYIGLFTELSRTCTPAGFDKKTIAKGTAQSAAETVINMAESQAGATTAAFSQKVMDKLRDTPYADVESVVNAKSLIGRFIKKK